MLHFLAIRMLSFEFPSVEGYLTLLCLLLNQDIKLGVIYYTLVHYVLDSVNHAHR